jgi:hypothetical protein
MASYGESFQRFFGLIKVVLLMFVEALKIRAIVGF